jgi:hypothetical protein
MLNGQGDFCTEGKSSSAHRVTVSTHSTKDRHKSHQPYNPASVGKYRIYGIGVIGIVTATLHAQ